MVESLNINNQSINIMKEKTRQKFLAAGRQVTKTRGSHYPHTPEQAIGLLLLGITPRTNNGFLSTVGVEKYHYDVGSGCSSKTAHLHGLEVQQDTCHPNGGGRSFDEIRVIHTSTRAHLRAQGWQA